MTREEAIKILREAHDNALFSVRTALETLIPELQESEDERMLQTIIRGFENCKRNGMEMFNNTKIDDILVYLEKQKEIGIQWLKSDNVKNPDTPYIDKAGMFYTTDGRMCYASDIEKQKEQKPAEWSAKGRRGRIGSTPEYIRKKAENFLSKMEPPYDADDICSAYETGAMESIKQEWSEEDEKMLRTIISDGSRGVELDSKQISWLKSLRPQPHWKPSEDQMDALKVTLEYMPDTFKPRCTLMTLQNDLEKLM